MPASRPHSAVPRSQASLYTLRGRNPYNRLAHLPPPPSSSSMDENGPSIVDSFVGVDGCYADDTLSSDHHHHGNATATSMLPSDASPEGNVFVESPSVSVVASYSGRPASAMNRFFVARQRAKFFYRGMSSVYPEVREKFAHCESLLSRPTFAMSTQSQYAPNPADLSSDFAATVPLSRPHSAQLYRPPSSKFEPSLANRVVAGPHTVQKGPPAHSGHRVPVDTPPAAAADENESRLPAVPHEVLVAADVWNQCRPTTAVSNRFSSPTESGFQAIVDATSPAVEDDDDEERRHSVLVIGHNSDPVQTGNRHSSHRHATEENQTKTSTTTCKPNETSVVIDLPNGCDEGVVGREGDILGELSIIIPLTEVELPASLNRPHSTADPSAAASSSTAKEDARSLLPSDTHMREAGSQVWDAPTANSHNASSVSTSASVANPSAANATSAVTIATDTTASVLPGRDGSKWIAYLRDSTSQKRQDYEENSHPHGSGTNSFTHPLSRQPQNIGLDDVAALQHVDVLRQFTPLAQFPDELAVGKYYEAVFRRLLTQEFEERADLLVTQSASRNRYYVAMNKAYVRWAETGLNPDEPDPPVAEDPEVVALRKTQHLRNVKNILLKEETIREKANAMFVLGASAIHEMALLLLEEEAVRAHITTILEPERWASLTAYVDRFLSTTLVVAFDLFKAWSLVEGDIARDEKCLRTEAVYRFHEEAKLLGERKLVELEARGRANEIHNEEVKRVSLAAAYEVMHPAQVEASRKAAEAALSQEAQQRGSQTVVETEADKENMSDAVTEHSVASTTS